MEEGDGIREDLQVLKAARYLRACLWGGEKL